MIGREGRVGPQVKGVALRTIDACFRELRGAHTHARAHELIAQAEPELERTFRNVMLASAWYPVSWYRETFRAYRLATGEGLELPRAIGKAAVRQDMSGVHKQLLLKVVSPQVLLGMSQRVFGTYYDHGSMQVLESRKGYAQVQLQGCTGWCENMWNEVLGSCAMLLELAGATHIRARIVTGGRDGDTHALIEAHWV